MPRSRSSVADQTPLNGLDYSADPGLDRWPELIAHLADGSWDDGSPRKTGRLSVFVQDGIWKACLTEPEGSAVAFISAPSFAALADAVEEALQTGRLEWKTDRRAQRPHRSR